MKYILLFLVSFSAYAVDINIDERSTVTLNWQNPTEYTDGSALPPENLIRTILERNCSDSGWMQVNEIEAPATTYSDPTATIGVATCLYRAKTVAIGAVITQEAESGYSNTIDVVFYRPKSPTAPILQAE